MKRRVALLVALAAVLAGGTAVALGATGASHSRRPHVHRAHRQAHARGAGLLAASSSYLGLPPARLRSEIEGGKTLAQIASATPGKSEAGLVAALIAAGRQRLHSIGSALPERVQRLVHGRPGRDASARGGRPALLAVALSYLGLERRALRNQLRSGMTLAQVADATPGRSAAGLREAILAAIRQRLDGRVAAHALTAAVAKHRLSHLEDRLDALLNRPHAGHATHAQRRPPA